MRERVRVASAAIVAAALSGCVSLGSDEPQRYYVLEDAGAVESVPGVPRKSTLLVSPTTAPGFYQTQEMVYSRAPGTRAYYRFHYWTDRPARLITALLVARLQRARMFDAVGAAVSGLQGNVILHTHLTEFYHDASTSPGSVKVTITAELTDPARRVLLARQTFERSAAAASYDAPGAVQAFDSAVAAMFDDISAWVNASAPR